MRFDYVVTLKKVDEKYIDLMNLFLCLFAVVAFAYEQLNHGHLSLLLSMGAALVFFGLAANLLATWKKKTIRYKNLLFVAGIFWLGMPHLQWIGVVYFALELLQHQAKRPLEIGFSDGLVEVNSLPKRKYRWSDFNNVVLKDGLLTLDFKDNRLFQKETQEDEDDDADEDEFNAYCSRQLNQAQG